MAVRVANWKRLERIKPDECSACILFLGMVRSRDSEGAKRKPGEEDGERLGAAPLLGSTTD